MLAYWLHDKIACFGKAAEEDDCLWAAEHYKVGKGFAQDLTGELVHFPWQRVACHGSFEYSFRVDLLFGQIAQCALGIRAVSQELQCSVGNAGGRSISFQ